MMKLTKKGFTLIELLAVIVILAILVAVSIPAVTKYLTTARKGTYATNATTAIDAYRNYIVSNGITQDSNMTLTQLNGLLEKKLTTSPYGSAYEDFSKIYVTFDDNLIPTYSICLVDSEGNGVYSGTGESVAESNIKGDNIELAGTVTSCSLNSSLLPPTSESAFTFDSSTHTITGYDPIVGGTDVVLPSSIGGVTVTSIGASAFYQKGITSVVLPNGITSIGTTAFKSNQLTSIAIPDTVTSIAANAFAYNQLTSVIIPDNVTTIGNYAFYNNKIASLTLGSKLTTIGDFSFYGNSLTSTVLPNSLTTIGMKAFSVNKLTTITIGTGVTSIGQAAIDKTSFSNTGLVSIINKTGRSFDWGMVVNESTGYNFVTGTVVNTVGNITVSAS